MWMQEGRNGEMEFSIDIQNKDKNLEYLWLTCYGMFLFPVSYFFL